MFGKFRNQGTRQHNGIDLKASYGTPIFSMYGGIVYNSMYGKEAGYLTRIQSKVNGKTIIIEYFHLQNKGRLKAGTRVKAGDLIGYLGDSGSLKGAIAKGYTVSHLHIGVKEHDGSRTWGFKTNFSYVDPRPYLATQIDNNGKTTKKANCN